MAKTNIRAHVAKRIITVLLPCAALLAASMSAAPASASPTDGAFPWSMGGLRVGAVTEGGDNDVYAQFRNSDGSVRSFWPNQAGTDICAGASTLRLSRSRSNYKELVDALNLAGLSGRTVWVAYEPTAGVCYIKSLSVAMQ